MFMTHFEQERRKATITYLVKFYKWDLERLKCTQTLPPPYRDRDVVSRKLSSQKTRKKKRNDQNTFCVQQH